MSYSEKLAKVVADQLARFVTLNRHQLAGHVANLDFWIAEARHALEVLDGYETRFRGLKSGQDEYVKRHQTGTFFPTDPELQAAPSPLQRVPNAALREARRSLADATYHFLVRCYNDGLISEPQLRDLCRSLDIGIEAADLRRGHG